MGAEKADRQEQPTTDVPITHQTARVPSEWLDALLRSSCELPPDATEEEAATGILSAIAGTIDGVAFGVCLPTESGQVVVRRSQRLTYSHSPDPALLFPDFAHERVFSIAGYDGATLHIATDRDAFPNGDRALDSLVERLSMVIGASVQRTRAVRTARRCSDEVRDLQEQVIQSEKLASLGQIAAGIVHELNNPLTSIVAYSDYLRRRWEKAGGDPADRERLLRINEAAERILVFSRDLIAYSRPSNEVPAPVYVHDVIERALIFCEHVVEHTAVTVDRRFGEVLPILGVVGQLTQVFVNLFTNACHAMNRGGGHLCVTTELSVASDAVQIRVSDEGHGIGEEHRALIFDPFFTTKTDGTGTGLGLSIVAKIVRSHGGEILVEPNLPRGTTFVVTLPVAARAPREP
jgi:two-component system, NtrC family, sensor kinase